ncbi:MAG: NYN domain-containing protein, partial [Coriobacteriia bacterium]|nr:NYN domain-containing protein [Coriobacteriia bacterium]
GVKVIFSDYGKSADSVIERLAKQAVDAGIQVELVSSDALVQWTSLGKGVVRRSAAEFAQQLGFGYSEWERERDAHPKRSTLADRAGPEGAELLRRIRDGRS